ncbi:MAG: protein translocase subunit SecF [Bryobacteraceae bacterium]|jgi:preprotein translocase subunit SecF
MQIFKNTDFDFLGKKWPFIFASLVLSVAGLTSIVVKGGLRYGIDFREGTAMTVQFAYAPPLDKIRAAMSQKIKGEASVQNFTGASARNQVEIGTELGAAGQVTGSRAAMEDVLRSAFGQAGGGKIDFNNIGKDDLARQLRDPLAQNGVAMSDQQLEQLAAGMKQYAADKRSGLIADFSQLAGVPGVTPGVLNTLKQACYLSPYAIVRTEMVGPKVGQELRRKAVLATLYALGGMLVYIAFRFEWIYGLGAVIACFHDTIITIGLFSIFNKEISMTVIAALLTLVGYSMNDTIVIFDRIRENVKVLRREPLEAVMNKAVNQTLSRTIMTSGLTFLTVIALFIWGGPVLHTFSFALVCGILVGTYSSVFVASPIVLFWHNYVDRRKRGMAKLAR